MRRSAIAFFVFFVAAAFAAPTFAAGPLSPIAMVICDDRQGSGSYVSPQDGGYVISVGHVVLNDDGSLPTACAVGFSDDSGKVLVYYSATVVKSTFEERADRDLAVLRLGQRLAGPEGKPALVIATNEFATVGELVTVHGYPNNDGSRRTNSTGQIVSFGRGSVRMTAQIAPGYSGGPVLDANGHMVGIATRINFEVDDVTGAEKIVSYEAQDVLTLLAWLDEDPAGHDAYLTHANAPLYHSLPYLIRDEDLGCTFAVRTPQATTVYCLSPASRRYVFPNESTFFTWYADYGNVRFMETSRIADYRLIGNVTHRAGTLVKVQTDPKTYLVTDGIGTLREIPDERTAAAYFGSDWASRVRDVPDAFFVDYRLGKPLPVAP